MSPNGWFSQPVYIRGGDPEAMNEAELQYGGLLGVRFSYQNPPRSSPTESGTIATGETGLPKTFKIVKTDSSMSVAPYDGAVAWFSDQANNVVTTSPTSLGRGRVAGVFKCNVTPGYFTCVQVKGKGKVKFIDAPTAAPTAAGLLVIPSATAAKADCLAAGSAPTYPLVGRSAGTYDAAACECIVDIDVPEVL